MENDVISPMSDSSSHCSNAELEPKLKALTSAVLHFDSHFITSVPLFFHFIFFFFFGVEFRDPQRG